jgi:hypothetical protein
VRAQILRKLSLFAPSTDCDSMEIHVPRKLNTKMPEATVLAQTPCSIALPIQH